MALDLVLGVSSDGLRVAEAELTSDDPHDAVAQARAHGAELLWIHSNSDLSAFGFVRANGYLRLHVEAVSEGQLLREVDPDEYASLLDRSYRGLWGHKHVAPDTSAPPGAAVVGLYEGAEAIGLCTVFVSDRLIDGPGVVPEARTSKNYARLLTGACGILGPGSADLDSWGDLDSTIDAYTALGFAPLECVGGWELRV